MIEIWKGTCVSIIVYRSRWCCDMLQTHPAHYIILYCHYLLTPAFSASSRSLINWPCCSSLNVTSEDTSFPNPLLCLLLLLWPFILLVSLLLFPWWCWWRDDDDVSTKPASTICFSLPTLSTCMRYLLHSEKNGSNCSGFVTFWCSRNCTIIMV